MDLLDGLDAGALSGTALLATLGVLALIDSTSFGTLLVPVWLLLAPGRVRVARMAFYLSTIAVFYAFVGLAIMLGAGLFLDRFGGILDTRVAGIVQLIVGVGLLAFSFTLDSKKARERAAAEGGSGRVRRWRERALGTAPGSTSALVGLAIGMGLVEVATMLPYLAAIGLIATSGPGMPLDVGLLAAYCLVMILPAALLTVARVTAERWVTRPLQRLDGWLTKNAASTTAWVVGIVGFLIARDAVAQLGWGG
jgi:cytochrome c biogenesis protein CcdA